MIAPVNGFADDVAKVKKHAARRQSNYAKVAVVLRQEHAKKILAQRESLELVRSSYNIVDLLALKCVMDVSMTNSPFFAGKLVAPTFVIQ